FGEALARSRGPRGTTGPAIASKWRPSTGWRVGNDALERVANAQREAGPDRRTEIKRHPGNLVLPVRNIMRHDPPRADVTKTLEKSEKLAAIGHLGPPSAQVHRDIDGHEKRQIGCY